MRLFERGVPVFVDIRSDTLNLDENLIEAAITPKTKAIVPVHYAGVGCEMEKIMTIAQKYDLIVVEDAAQSICSRYEGKSLGSFGDLACISFHETKNIHCGEGGALLINNPKFAERAEIIREKGTNRTQFFRGQVDKYRWVDIARVSCQVTLPRFSLLSWKKLKVLLQKDCRNLYRSRLSRKDWEGTQTHYSC